MDLTAALWCIQPESFGHENTNGVIVETLKLIRDYHDLKPNSIRGLSPMFSTNIISTSIYRQYAAIIPAMIPEYIVLAVQIAPQIMITT